MRNEKLYVTIQNNIEVSHAYLFMEWSVKMMRVSKYFIKTVRGCNDTGIEVSNIKINRVHSFGRLVLYFVLEEDKTHVIKLKSL